MSGSATLPLKLRDVLDTAEMRIQAIGGIPHDEFWHQKWMRNLTIGQLSTPFVPMGCMPDCTIVLTW